MSPVSKNSEWKLASSIKTRLHIDISAEFMMVCKRKQERRRMIDEESVQCEKACDTRPFSSYGDSESGSRGVGESGSRGVGESGSRDNYLFLPFT